MMLAYCDYIASRIKTSLEYDVRENRQYTVVDTVGGVELDLHPETGHFVSTKKTIKVVDKGGKKYKITVEEI